MQEADYIDEETMREFEEAVNLVRTVESMKDSIDKETFKSIEDAFKSLAAKLE